MTKKERQLKGRQLVNALRHNSGAQKEKIRQELIRSNLMAIECFDCIRFIGNQGCCGRDNQINGYNQCYGRERQHSPCLYFGKMEREEGGKKPVNLEAVLSWQKKDGK